jgi:heat shock protein HtpX
MEWLRTVFFLGLLTGVLLLIGGLLGGPDGVLLAFGFAVLLNGFSYFFSDKIVLLMYRAKPLDVKTVQGIRVQTITKRVCELMKIPVPKLFMISKPSPNAFATGRNPNHAAVVFTNGILSLLKDNELEGVIAHELSHVKNRDILIASIAATIAGAIGTIAWWLQWTAIGSSFGGRNSEGRNPIGLLVIAITIPFIALLIRLAISRGREFLADETAAKTLGSGKGLASALAKLEGGIKRQPLDANNGTAHLFIANPFGKTSLMKFLSTHPDMQERIKRLEKY